MSRTLSLLREKFTIREIGTTAEPVIALGNRLQINIPNAQPLIIRCHSMHATLRFGAEIVKQLSFHDAITDMKTTLDWPAIWTKITAAFEKANTPNTWISLYFCGKSIFEDGDHHMFIDVLEQCEFQNKNDYEQALIVAQNAFQKMGKSVMIDHESHVGFILDTEADEFRFAIMMRVPGQRANFIIRMAENPAIKNKPSDYVAMNLAADYIEAINMAVRVGFIESAAESAGEDATKNKDFRILNYRLQDLTRSIAQFEIQYQTRYRPERPDFDLIREACKGSN
ncbi:MAG: hypothetical protein COB76_02735 [Alphaproteobacteria bacterium]|nr:MAG: hypothetical protein COB76_02735 [Alphaproteobacteria bacterium]